MNNKRIFSGIQPSGNLHLGNYLGAIKNWVKLQETHDSIFCIVDLHAITVPQKPEELAQKTLEVAKIYLAAGIDLGKSVIFVQSSVNEHTELMWILNTLTKTSDLFKMTQFKDKSSEETNIKNINAGLLNYPVLMAADILLYDTNLVPVGEDQLQHIELTRKLGRKFNQQFGETFVIPEGFVQKEGKRIMGLDNPLNKMSKSAPSEYNRINLLDSPEIITKKIMKAVTDSGQEIEYSDQKPALKNLLNIFSSVANLTPEKIALTYKDKDYRKFKEDLAEAVIDFLKPIQERYKEIDDETVKTVLNNGAVRARKLAQVKIKEIKKKMGIVI